MRLLRLSTVLSVFIILSAGIIMAKTSSTSPTRKTLEPSPKLERVIVYTWALQTAGVSVDFRTARMECFLVGCSDAEFAAFRKSHPKEYPATCVQATLGKTELKAIRGSIIGSHLRGFKPSLSDVNKRQPRIDERPPTIVLVWSDREQILQMPLYDTVKRSLPISRKRYYKGMDELYERIERTVSSYNRRPFARTVAVHGPEYRRAEKERERMLKPVTGQEG